MKVLAEGKYTGTIVRQADVGGAMVSATYSTKESSTDWHCHENLHFCLVYEGCSETRGQTTYASNRGTLLFYHSGELHRWRSPPYCKSANVEVSAAFLEQNGLSEKNINRAVSDNLNALPLILRMQRELLLNLPECGLSLQQMLLELVCHPTSPRNSHRPAWVSKVDELLRDNWNHNMTLAEIALVADVHPVTVSKSFRKHFGCTLGDYRRRLKINQSILLIRDPRSTLTEIAAHCGFADQSHFIRTFKELTGFLPRQFRHF